MQKNIYISINVYLEIDGKQKLAGKITGSNHNNSCFKYDKDFIKKYPYCPISLSLPIQSSEFSPECTKNYFDGLLPEGFQRHNICQNAHIDEDNYLDLLLHLGNECLGAILVDNSKRPIKNKFNYKLIKQKEIIDLAKEGASKSSEIVAKSHLSLAGASGKVGLYFDANNSQWYKPIGAAPSTHIVKTEHVRLDDIVTNEYLCTQLAGALGIQVPEVSIIGDKYLLFTTKRYDRTLNSKNLWNKMLKIPYRLHQEDFAQALGIPSTKKYEKNKNEYLSKCFELIRNFSSDPIADQKKLIQTIIFNILIGNTDNHIKNIGLLRSQNMKTLRLAPAYDLVSTVAYNDLSRDLAFFVGDTKNIYKINRNSLKIAAHNAKLSEELFIKILDDFLLKFKKELDNVLSANPYLNKQSKIKNSLIVHFEKVKENLSEKK